MCQKTHEGSQKPVRPKACVPGEALVMVSAVHTQMHCAGSLTDHGCLSSAPSYGRLPLRFLEAWEPSLYPFSGVIACWLQSHPL